MDEAVIAVTESQARVVTVDAGSVPARQSVPIKEGTFEWFGLTVHGQRAWALMQANARIGVII